jgi:hypothetical protein
MINSSSRKTKLKMKLRSLALLVPGLRHAILMRERLLAIDNTLQKLCIEIASLPRSQSVMFGEIEFKKSDRYRDPLRLLSWGGKVNSQNGEDGMIAEIFRRIGTKDKVFVEIGVEDGRQCNTAFLIACGWSGTWIDSSSAMKETTASKSTAFKQAITTATAVVTAESVSNLFESLKIPREFDFLSIDIDQNTYFAWKALSEYRPRVVVIEYNSIVPPSVDWKTSYSPFRVWDGSQNFGASLKAIELLGDTLGYCLVGCDYTGTNAFFVRCDLVDGLFAAPFTAENHYEPSRPPLSDHRIHRPEILDRMDEAE